MTPARLKPLPLPLQKILAGLPAQERRAVVVALNAVQHAAGPDTLVLSREEEARRARYEAEHPWYPDGAGPVAMCTSLMTALPIVHALHDRTRPASVRAGILRALIRTPRLRVLCMDRGDGAAPEDLHALLALIPLDEEPVQEWLDRDLLPHQHALLLCSLNADTTPTREDAVRTFLARRQGDDEAISSMRLAEAHAALGPHMLGAYAEEQRAGVSAASAARRAQAAALGARREASITASHDARGDDSPLRRITRTLARWWRR